MTVTTTDPRTTYALPARPPGASGHRVHPAWRLYPSAAVPAGTTTVFVPNVARAELVAHRMRQLAHWSHLTRQRRTQGQP